jgi:hypothetical protein
VKPLPIPISPHMYLNIFSALSHWYKKPEQISFGTYAPLVSRTKMWQKIISKCGKKPNICLLPEPQAFQRLSTRFVLDAPETCRTASNQRFIPHALKLQLRVVCADLLTHKLQRFLVHSMQGKMRDSGLKFQNYTCECISIANMCGF